MLALETAAYAGASLALLELDGTLIEQVAIADSRTVAATLVPQVDALLARHAQKKVATIAVDCGPGSFTGIRIGIATALGIADGFGASTIGVSQFDLFDVPLEPTCILIDARASGYYYQLNMLGKAHERGFVAHDRLAALLENAGVARGIVFGDAPAELIEGTGWRLDASRPVIDASAVGRVACTLLACCLTPPLEPQYLHPGFFRKMA